MADTAFEPFDRDPDRGTRPDDLDRRPGRDFAAGRTTRVRIRVEGIVQGVGFRPYVHALARRLELSGWVGNDGRGVFIEAEGPEGDVTRFREELPCQAPPLALIHRISADVIPVLGERGFHIAGSRDGGRSTLIPADAATCDDCLAELFDPACRRYLHPFVNCTNCGPRFTVVTGLPYDREATTMAAFPMCGECAAEYHDPSDRRFHAQPICCPACGPALRLLGPPGRPMDGDPVETAAALLRAGRIVAVKGLGGYHLAVDATNGPAVRMLRERKHRPDKPFAVMVADLAMAARLCEIGPDAERLLNSPARPIVVLPRRAGETIADETAPGVNRLGIMLPYTALHHLLARKLTCPYVLTSGNVSDEPIVHRDRDATDRLGRGLADAFLTHDRTIQARAEDSVILLAHGRRIPIRRSRGFAPLPLPLSRPARRAILACGAELKSTFCLVRGGHAFLSPHVGDLKDYATLRAFTEEITRFRRLFDVTPELVVHDAHPEYLSTKYAQELADVDLVAVQHHHAHIASCLADGGEEGTVIGVAFDGTGHGPDGTVWGGELLVADLTGFTRAGHLAPVPMPGGTAAIRQPWRMAAAHLDAAFDGAPPPDLAVRLRNAAEWDRVTAVARSGLNSPLTSSAGRLFDAVAALCGLGDRVTFEGQAAMALEQRADPAEQRAYPMRIEPGTAFVNGAGPVTGPVTCLVIRGDDLIRAVAEDLLRGTGEAEVSARFHNGLAAAVAAACALVRDGATAPAGAGIGTVALSGGVFQNALLLDRCVRALKERGFRVLTHRRVPPNDAGICLGQAAVAAAMDLAPARSVSAWSTGQGRV
ncbi:carbamoyltransferase HypF [Sphaerimonospora sp. CA-214678]|uniref:carbamoyltransferase HypF n=1 Tax=Sphaerimonospora sp. CA-214678 TaxID=3240029 RepID=UPI003D8E901E